ncbi:MAG: class I SAM-dependent methyltransferase [Myxococcota bacterium]
MTRASDDADRLERPHWWCEGRRRVLREVLRRQLLPRTGRRILDVECGGGGMFPVLAEFGVVEAVEAREEARAAARHPTLKVAPCRLPDELPQGRWDLITAFDVLAHVDDPIAALRAMRARLVFDGQVVVTTPAFPELWGRHDERHHHRRRYRRLELVSHLAAAGLRVTWVSYFDALLLPALAGARLLERLVPDRAPAEPSTPPAALNRVLTEVFSSERLALGLTRLPLGASLVAVAQRG